jgi:hypothetical protein
MAAAGVECDDLTPEEEAILDKLVPFEKERFLTMRRNKRVMGALITKQDLEIVNR